MKTMPPLRALVVFEAAVRHASFKAAAEELHLTPGAVGQQVRKLEAWLGFSLFQRSTRQVVVTARGMAYYSRVAPALEQIAQASHSQRQQHLYSVHLSLTQALAARWLAPRIADFIARYPQFDVHINASNQLVDLEREPVDLAIRHFDGRDPALHSTLLYQDRILLLCAPDYQQQVQLHCADDLTRATLLHISVYQSWEAWLDRFTTLSEGQRRRMRGVHFDQTLLALDAARRGQGVVLTSELLAQEELRRGELIEPLPLRLQQGKGFYLVYPRSRPLSAPAEALRTWLLEQFGVISPA